jgi:hypothetical protein
VGLVPVANLAFGNSFNRRITIDVCFAQLFPQSVSSDSARDWKNHQRADEHVLIGYRAVSLRKVQSPNIRHKSLSSYRATSSKGHLPVCGLPDRPLSFSSAGVVDLFKIPLLGHSFRS